MSIITYFVYKKYIYKYLKNEIQYTPCTSIY